MSGAGDLLPLALSVWSNTCNAYCSEEDRVHASECLLASKLYSTVMLDLPDVARAWEQGRASGLPWADADRNPYLRGMT